MKIIYIVLGILLVFPFKAQSENPEVIRKRTLSEDAFFYKQTKEWQKFKILCACGWSAFSIGGTLMTVGSIAYVADNMETPDTNSRFLVMACIGGVLTAASIPTLVLAYKNRRKALFLGATTQIIYTPMQTEQQPALSFRFTF